MGRALSRHREPHGTHDVDPYFVHLNNTLDLMSNVIKQRIKELAPLYGSSSFATWHLKAILDILLRSLLEDFRFVGDLGLSETDRGRVDATFNGLAGYYSATSLTKQAWSLPSVQ